MSDLSKRLTALEYLGNLVDADDDDYGDILRTRETRNLALDILSGETAEVRQQMTPADHADYAWDALMAHPIVQQLNWDSEGDHDRWGQTMKIGFTVCDALTMRGEHVPTEMNYRPGPLPSADDFDRFDAEEAEAGWPDHGDLYFAWGLGLGDNVMGSIDADELRDYLTGPWQAAHDALKAAGEDY